MCGFAGFKLFKQTQAIDHTWLRKMSESLSHRGPDGEGFWVQPDQTAAFVARRLSILDTSPAGSQPMIDQEQEILITFNGEIYNFVSLRQKLIASGYTFRSNSDTEVFLYAFKKWGITCINQLDGMFAAAIYNLKTQELFLVRDRIGIKPLYFSLQGNAINFASEIKALWHLPWMTKRISHRALSHYLTFLSTPAPMTLYDGVYKLPAGFYAHIDKDGSINFTQWYDPLLMGASLSTQDVQKKSFCVNSIKTLVQEAVRKRLVSDVPIGAFLSGGLDSSLLVALMAQEMSGIKTFNVSFEYDEQREERAWARKVAKKFSTDHHELILTEQDAFSFFEKMSYYQDEPLGDSVCVPLYFVSKLARDHGVTVVLSGEGSDELFCGYSFYVDYIRLQKYWQITQHYLPRAAKKGLYYAARPFYEHAPNRQDMLRAWADDKSLFWGGVRVFLNNGKKHSFLMPQRSNLIL